MLAVAVDFGLSRSTFREPGISARFRRSEGDMGRIVVEQITGEADVLRLRVLPVLLGCGRSFSPSDLGMRRLSLASAQSFAGGLVGLEYHAASSGIGLLGARTTSSIGSLG